MKQLCFCLVFFLHLHPLNAQIIDTAVIHLQDVETTMQFLAGDSMKGRADESKELQQAAFYIEHEFAKDSLSFFGKLASYLQPFVLGDFDTKDATRDSLGHFVTLKILYNIVGVLPGETIPNEVIVFSAHYDHIGSNNSHGDHIFNGANDDASGTTALLLLARYFAQKHNNARTLVFCAFAGEELGLVGSDVFTKHLNYKDFVAGINIEMIGIPQEGKNRFFITGSTFSDFSRIIRKNLAHTPFRLSAEPDLSKNLFQRSDNYSFARYGIPAHTIMTSDDTDPCYHQPCDELKRIDFAHMKNIIEAIIIGTRTLVNGTSTPHRLAKN
jgi:hypothetical protein